MGASDDLAAVMRHQRLAGLASDAVYTPKDAAASTALTLSIAESEMGTMDDIGGHIQRRTLTAYVPRSMLANPQVHASVVIASGQHAGAYRIITVGQRDPAGTMVTMRDDTVIKARSAGVERSING